jgi:hypothetical protein
MGHIEQNGEQSVPTRRLLALANEMIALIDELNAENPQGGSPTAQSDRTQAREDIEHWAAKAKELYECRRRRDKVFGPEMFGEPAWDIILDLFISECDGRRISVTSACIASCVPKATALRVIKQLEKTGIVVRQRDPDDARRSYVRLSQRALLSVAPIFHTANAFADEGAVREDLNALLLRSHSAAA